MPEERADPRQVRSREAMVTAATALLTEGGLEAVTHQAVAARARVGRATVYRHWADVLGLRLAALEAGMPPLSPAPEDVRAASGAEPRAELVHYLRQLAERLDDAQAGAVLAAVLGGAQYDEGMRRLRHTVLTQVVDSLRPAVTAAVARGHLRDDVTAEMFAMTIVGPLVYQRFLVGARLGHDMVDDVVDASLRAWAP
ncbi:DNA-binding transcriptional regulator, AcrR family [Streptomyces sp. 3213]|uniref:TetR/AcrR family transcriptional regulator n=1 Tax=Streptomyces sp. 3213.3 TaxID=1855348 RepID=UPI00089AFDFE|nr:TetR/AcrR family transcriptional regulator [Streptomyces sp. 3213.3]SEC81674.1 DNA-binding transcriptional regulator, AcrR family [Streptomyces sp. 3213] [Streptomyces sp. 3213.3]